MNKDVFKVKKYYDNGDEENRFSDPRKKVEYINTCKILGNYVKPGDKIIDCAAGTGAYEDFLLLCDCDSIYASDLSDRNVSILREKYKNNEKITIFQDNALDLYRYADKTFDVVLCLGPLYHLKRDDISRCIEECMRILKDGAHAFFAYMPRNFVVWNLINNPVYKIPFDEVMYLAENGHFHNISQGFWGCSYFYTPEEMLEFFEPYTDMIVEHRSVDMELGNFFEKISTLNGTELDRLTEYIYKNSSSPYVLGSSKHNLIVVKKC